MFRNVAVIAAVAAAAIVASPQAHAQYYATSAGPYATNPGPYSGYAPTPYASGYGGMVTSNVAYAPGSYYGYGDGSGPYSGPFRTDSSPGVSGIGGR